VIFAWLSSVLSSSQCFDTVGLEDEKDIYAAKDSIQLLQRFSFGKVKENNSQSRFHWNVCVSEIQEIPAEQCRGKIHTHICLQ